MKENHSSQNAQESGTSSFTRLRSKLSFERMVEMGAKMGMDIDLAILNAALIRKHHVPRWAWKTRSSCATSGRLRPPR